MLTTLFKIAVTFHSFVAMPHLNLGALKWDTEAICVAFLTYRYDSGKSCLKYVNTDYIPHGDVLLLLSLLFLRPPQHIKHHCDILSNECQDQSIFMQHTKESAEKEKYVNVTVI